MLSKSCENSIVCWKPGTLSQDQQNEREREQRSTIIHKLDVGIIFTFLSADISKCFFLKRFYENSPIIVKTLVNSVQFRSGIVKSGL